MAARFVSVEECWHGTKARMDADQAHVAYTVVWQVIVDCNQFVRAAEILAAPGLPRVFDVYSYPTENDPEAFCHSVIPMRDPDCPEKWLVTVEYDSHTVDPTQVRDDPLIEPTHIEWGWADTTRAIQSDDDQNPVLNSAKQPFDPPPDYETSDNVLVMRRNEPFFDEIAALSYTNAVNDDVWYAGAQGTWKAKISGSRRHDRGLLYWEVTYEFKYKRDGWAKRILDSGKAEVIDGELQVIKDRFGIPISEPVPLNGAGKNLKRATTTVDMPGGFGPGPNPVIIGVADFSNFLGLGCEITIDNEDFLVVGVAGTSLVCIPGYNVTTMAFHADGATVKQKPVYLIYNPYPELSFNLLNLP